MLLARFTDGDWLIGVDAENIRRLVAREPIRVLLPDQGFAIMIMYGETLAEIRAELEAATGQPLPQPMVSSPESTQ